MNIDRLIAKAKNARDEKGLDTLYYVAELATRMDINLKGLAETALTNGQGDWITERSQLNSIVLSSLTKQSAVHAVSALIKADTPKELPLFSPADLQMIQRSTDEVRQRVTAQEAELEANIRSSTELARKLGDLAVARMMLRVTLTQLRGRTTLQEVSERWHDAVVDAEQTCPSWKFLSVRANDSGRLSFTWISTYPVRIRRLLYPNFTPAETGHWLAKVSADTGEVQVLNVPVLFAHAHGKLRSGGQVQAAYRHCTHPNISAKGIWCWGSQARLYEKFQADLVAGAPNFSQVLRLLSNGLAVANEGDGGPFWAYAEDGLPSTAATYPTLVLPAELLAQIETMIPHAADPMYVTPAVPPAVPPEAPILQDGYDEDGYDREGYDEDGYDRDGFDQDGYNRDGYDRDGRDRDGYDQDVNDPT